MSKAPQELFGWSAAFVDRWTVYLQAHFKPNDLRNYFLQEWFALGFGTPGWGTGIDAVKDWLNGKSEPSATYSGVFARAINRALREVEAPEEAQLPEIPFPQAGPRGGDGLPVDSAEIGSTKGRHRTAPAYITPPSSARRVA